METYFDGFATLLSVAVAIAIYFRRIRDNKKDAAKVLLIEITEAEGAINAFKKAQSRGEKFIPDEAVLSTSSWEKYKHLFINDFTTREWSRVSDFYSNCGKLDEAITLNQSFFGKNEQAVRDVLYKSFGRFVTDELTKAEEGAYNVKMPDGSVKMADDAGEQFKQLVGTKIAQFPQLFLDLLKENRAHYMPDKPIQDTNMLMGYIDTSISDSEIATKLKKIAKLKKTAH